MDITATVVLDSVSNAGVRLATIEAVHPRFILAEVNTHRHLTRNGASSRAIMFERMVEAIRAGFARPLRWLMNKPGMVATEPMDDVLAGECDAIWLDAMEDAIKHAMRLNARGASKQYVNRLLEPWMMQKTLLSSTRWANFFKLRDEPTAQPEFQELARAMKAALAQSKPVLRHLHHVYDADWHLPYVQVGELKHVQDLLDKGKATAPFEALASTYSPEVRTMMGMSVARCCRVTTQMLDGSKPSVEKDMKLVAKLMVDPLHASPFEHVAAPLQTNRSVPSVTGNFHGWAQLRKMLPGEALDEAA